MYRKLLLLPFAFFFAACHSPYFQNDLVFERPGKKYKFTVAVTGDKLYLYGKYNGKDLDGLSGRAMIGKEIFKAAATDLDADGNPEVYVFFSPRDIGPGIYAMSCEKEVCSPIGIEGSAGGPLPKDYCGEDSFQLERSAIVRRYKVCGKTGTTTGELKYSLRKTSQGLLLGVAGGANS